MWQTLLAVAFWVAVWQGLAVCIGHNGLFLATPLQTVQTLWRLLPTADFWHRVGFSALRILTGFVLAVTVGLLLGACGARWRWFGTLVGPVMQLIRAMPVASFVILALLWVSGKNLSVIVSFTHVLPVVYAGTVGGIADTDPALLEMAKVYRLPLGKRLYQKKKPLSRCRENGFEANSKRTFLGRWVKPVRPQRAPAVLKTA